jgi:hypothetical protein
MALLSAELRARLPALYSQDVNRARRGNLWVTCWLSAGVE